MFGSIIIWCNSQILNLRNTESCQMIRNFKCIARQLLYLFVIRFHLGSHPPYSFNYHIIRQNNQIPRKYCRSSLNRSKFFVDDRRWPLGTTWRALRKSNAIKHVGFAQLDSHVILRKRMVKKFGTYQFIIWYLDSFHVWSQKLELISK